MLSADHDIVTAYQLDNDFPRLAKILQSKKGYNYPTPGDETPDIPKFRVTTLAVKFGHVLESGSAEEGKKSNKNFNRMAALYKESLTSPFLYPVWDVNINGKILQPNLCSLEPLLLKDSSTFIKILHRIFLPVAMAIDFLHTPIPHKKKAYFHRDVHIHNVYVPIVPCSEWSPRVYGNARLMVTCFTKEVFHEESTLNSCSFGEYYHHPDLVDQLSCYKKEYDWYSFGIFILEVLCVILGLRDLQTLLRDKGTDISQVIKGLHECITSKNIKKEINIWCQEYMGNMVEIAEKCIIVQATGSESSPGFDFVSEYKYRGEDFHFEYPISEIAAPLMCSYLTREKSSRVPKFHATLPLIDTQLAQASANYENQQIKDQPGLCQGCLLEKPVSLQMLSTRKERKHSVYTCGENRASGAKESEKQSKCAYYCASCYKNSERKFCPVHGTASCVIGHSSVYALILYGEEYLKPRYMSAFAKDAEKVRNILMHQQIIGIRKENVLFVNLADIKSTPIEKLKEAVSDLRKKIHSVADCEMKHNYDLYIYYSGHGGQSKEECGYWYPARDFPITDVQVKECLRRLRECKNCQKDKSCQNVYWIMDHCFATDHVEITSMMNNETPAKLWVTMTRDIESRYNEEGSSYVTEWISQLLTSQFEHRCLYFTGKKKTSGEECEACRKIKSNINGLGAGIFIPLRAAKSHKPHFQYTYEHENEPFHKSSLKVDFDATDESRMLCHYNEGGIQYIVFPLSDGDSGHTETLPPIQFRYDTEISLKSIKVKIAEKLRNSRKSYEVVLLSNLPRDYTRYSLVWEEELRHVMENGSRDVPRGDQENASYRPTTPATLHYSIIRKSELVKINLKCNGLSPVIIEIPMKKTGMAMRDIEEHSYTELPNVLAYVIYELYHKPEIWNPSLDLPDPEQHQTTDASPVGEAPSDLHDSEEFRAVVSFLKQIDPLTVTPRKWDSSERYYRFKHLETLALNDRLLRKFKYHNQDGVITLEWSDAALEDSGSSYSDVVLDSSIGNLEVTTDSASNGPVVESVYESNAHENAADSDSESNNVMDFDSHTHDAEVDAEYETHGLPIAINSDSNNLAVDSESVSNNLAVALDSVSNDSDSKTES